MNKCFTESLTMQYTMPWIFLFKPVSIAAHIVIVSATKALQILVMYLVFCHPHNYIQYQATHAVVYLQIKDYYIPALANVLQAFLSLLFLTS